MKKCCLRTCISLLVFVVIIAVGVIVLLNLTPKQLHLADKSIAGSTVEEYGLADVKLIKIIKGFRGLSKKESKVVANAYNPTDEADSAKALFANSTYEHADNYAQLVVDQATYDKRYLRSVNDTTVAYVLNNVIGETYALDAGDGNKTPAMSVREVTVSKTDKEGVQTGHLRMVVGVAAKSFINLEKLSGVLDKVKIIKLPEYVYVVCTADFTVSADGAQAGKIVFQNTHANIGGDEKNALNSFLFGILNKAIGQSVEDPAKNEETFASVVFDKTAAVINHIGEIGTASTSVDGKFVVVGAITRGMAGVSDGKLFFITSTAE